MQCDYYLPETGVSEMKQHNGIENIFAGVGCNGRGIAMATTTGRLIAELICGRDEKNCSVPIRKPKRVFVCGMRHPGVAIGVLYSRFLDTVERLK